RWADFGRSWNRKAAAYRPSVPFSGGGYQDPATRRYMARRRTELIAQFGSARDVPPGLQAAPVTEGIDVPDDAYRDGITAEAAVRTLRQFAETPDKPFFLAVGFQKPHLPFIAPKKYWDLYDPAEIPIVTDEFDIVAPSIARHASFELRTRGGVPNYGPIDDDLSRHLRHAYYACVSYIDAQLGKVLDELEATGFAENTVIVFWGDHGWHLGDHGIWGKATNYEVATRVPLIFAGPGVRESSRTDRIAELVDLYPTLLELAGATPKAGLDGDSLVDTLADGAEPDDAAFSQYPCAALREWAAMPLQPAMRESFFGPLISDIEARLAEESPRYDRTLYENEIMGYTVRTDRYRLVLWLDRRDPTGEPYAAELYDHESDTRERSSLADDPAYADVVTRLRGRLLSTYFPDAAGDL
ncbi:MAG: sulfatase, partial [Planctomycetota bacterium]